MGTSLAKMKIYISVDIEGVAGITHWDEAEKGHADWGLFFLREIMHSLPTSPRVPGTCDSWTRDRCTSSG